MSKFLFSIASALVSLAMTGYLELVADDPPKSEDGPRAVRKIEVRGPIESEGRATSDDATEALQQAYELLNRLRGENAPPGDAPPREWLERATRFYREGVESFEAGETEKARALAAAARELANAVVFSRQAARIERPDPELPPPPGRRARMVIRELRHGDAPPLPPDAPAPPDAPRRPDRIIRIEDPDGPRREAVVRLRGLMDEQRAVAESRAREAREKAVELKAIIEDQIAKSGKDAEEQVKEIEVQIRELSKQAEAAARGAARRSEEHAEISARHAESDRHSKAERIEAPNASVAASPEAREALKAAYDRLQEATESADPRARFYLDAARDLYNAARRDAVAGRNDRAIELARAAQALAIVPKHMDAISHIRVERRAETRTRIERQGPDGKNELIEERIEGGPVIEERIEGPREAPKPPEPPDAPKIEDGQDLGESEIR